MKILNKVKFILLIMFFMTLITATKSFAVTGVITEITVNLRKEPSTDSKKIMYVTQDDVVEVLEKDGDWYKIKFKGTTGYVFGKYVKVDDSKLETTQEKEDEKTENVDTTNKSESTKEQEQEVNKNEENVNTNLIIKNKTQIRLIPNISSSIIYTAKEDIKIDVVEQLKDWSYIAVSGLQGWVRTDKIVEENEVLPDKKEETKNENKDTTKQETKTAYIKYDTVNLRKKASTSSTVLAKLKLNDKVTVLEEVDNKWSKIKVDGITGYVSTELLSDKQQKKSSDKETTSRDGEEISRNEVENTVEKEESTKKEEETKTEQVETKKEESIKTETVKKEETTVKEQENSKKENTTVKEESKKENTASKVTGEDIVSYAKKYLGYKYVLGGSSPKTGFDCSGFTKYVYNHFGYTISRTSKTQAKNGKEVAKKDLQPGDIIIFKNQSLTAIGHVAIYIGDNKIIHASEPGVGVTITDMDARGYNYNKRYVTARRII